MTQRDDVFDAFDAVQIGIEFMTGLVMRLHSRSEFEISAHLSLRLRSKPPLIGLKLRLRMAIILLS